MQTMRGVVITGKGTLAVSDDCPLPEAPCATGAFAKPLIWSPCTSDAHLCETGCESLPYLLGKAMGLFLKHDRSMIKPVIYND